MKASSCMLAPLVLALAGCVGYGYPVDGHAAGGYQDGYHDPSDRYYPGGYPGSTFRCESHDRRTRECPSPGGQARFVRQLSDTACIQGRTWGYTRNGVWVSSGCRAEFSTYGGGYGPGYPGGEPGYSRVVRCESRDSRPRRCPSALGSRPRIARQLSDSPCIEGRTWGWDHGSIWVSHGCRADFVASGGWWDNRPGYGPGDGAGYGQTVRCESRDNRRRYCDVAVRYGVTLQRQLSDTRCVHGRNWGWDRRGIWVDGGCRADFNVR